MQPNFKAHTLLAASLVLFVMALVNAIQCIASIDWKRILIAVYRAGVLTRRRLNATVEAAVQLAQATKAQAISTRNTITTTANPTRLFSEVATSINLLVSDVVTEATR